MVLMNQQSTRLSSVQKPKEEILVEEVSIKNSFNIEIFKSLREIILAKFKNILPKFLFNILEKIISLIEEFINLDEKYAPSIYSLTNLPPDIEDLINWAKKVIGFQNFYPLITFHDAPRFFHYGCYSNITNKTDGYLITPHGSSVSLNFQGSLRKAIYECIERTVFATYRKEKLIPLKIKDLKEPAFNPLEFNFFSEEQYQREPLINHKITPDSLIYWQWGKDLLSGKDVLIPAQLIYWNYKRENNEPRIWDINTNGEALGSSFNEALISAIYELIERDAFMIYWFKKIVPPRVDLYSINDEEIKKILEKYERYNLKIDICQLETEFKLPVYLSIIRDFTGIGPAVSISASCKFDDLESIKKSILEVAKIYHYVRSLKRKADKFPYLNSKAFVSKLGQKDRLLLWSQKEMLSRIEWLVSGDFIKIDNLNKNYSPQEELSYLKNKIKELNFHCYFADVTTEDLKGRSLWAVKAIIPELVPLHLNEQFAHLGVKRLYKTYPNSLLKENELNDLPHPFS